MRDRILRLALYLKEIEADYPPFGMDEIVLPIEHKKKVKEKKRPEGAETLMTKEEPLDEDLKHCNFLELLGQTRARNEKSKGVVKDYMPHPKARWVENDVVPGAFPLSPDYDKVPKDRSAEGYGKYVEKIRKRRKKKIKGFTTAGTKKPFNFDNVSMRWLRDKKGLMYEYWVGEWRKAKSALWPQEIKDLMNERNQQHMQSIKKMLDDSKQVEEQPQSLNVEKEQMLDEMIRKMDEALIAMVDNPVRSITLGSFKKEIERLKGKAYGNQSTASFQDRLVRLATVILQAQQPAGDDPSILQYFQSKYNWYTPSVDGFYSDPVLSAALSRVTNVANQVKDKFTKQHGVQAFAVLSDSSATTGGDANIETIKTPDGKEYRMAFIRINPTIPQWLRDKFQQQFVGIDETTLQDYAISYVLAHEFGHLLSGPENMAAEPAAQAVAEEFLKNATPEISSKVQPQSGGQ